jgi:hypothetical protein
MHAHPPTFTTPPPQRCAPALYRLVHKTAFIHLLMRPAVEVACAMTTVSGVIDDYAIK